MEWETKGSCWKENQALLNEAGEYWIREVPVA